MPQNQLKNILYIEDDAGLARLLQKHLTREHFQIDIATSAEMGLEMMHQQKYDLILLDYHLPGMNGLELLDILNKESGNPPVIILTTGGDERIAVAALQKGAADYAVKDAGQSYFDLLPAIMQAAQIREALQRENERQRQELSDAKEKAEAANSAKSNFLATMSHEIRTPLNVVIGLTSMLAKTQLDSQQQRIVNTLSSNADLLLKLINDLLDISRIEAGHVELETRRFMFKEVVEDICQMFSQSAKDKGLELTCRDHTEGHTYFGDRTRIQQILMNLVSNAIKFTDHGFVSVEVFPLDETNVLSGVEMIVRDSGIGIDPTKLATIFDKFTQADETITRRFGGSGLGLSIARTLSEMMDGTIDVQSRAGKGSQFKVRLRLNASTDVMSTPAPQPIQKKVKQPMSQSNEILLVEDYAPNVMVATMMLEDMGYQVISAENGARALEFIEARETPFAAILMDVQMHEMDGFETTRRLRLLEQQKGFRHPVIGVTAHALAGDRDRCLSAGMDDYLSKPIHPELLASKLRAIV